MHAAANQTYWPRLGGGQHGISFVLATGRQSPMWLRTAWVGGLQPRM